jgi:hypothetical protein
MDLKNESDKSSKIQKNYISVGDIIKKLKHLPVIYSKDDEGNEYNMANNLLSIVRIKKFQSRFIDIIENSDIEDESDKEGIDVVIIN